MSRQEGHYRQTIKAGRGTRFARCGYKDRFDPFHLSQSPRLRALYEGLFSEFPGENPPGLLLDVGCGTGIYLESLASHGRSIHALDASCAMVGIAHSFCRERGLNHISALAAAAEALPYPQETFDAALAMDTLHHVESVEDAITEIWRVLKPGACFLVFEPNILNPLMWLAHALPAEERKALKRDRPDTLRALLESRFTTVRWQGISSLVTETTGIRRRILDAYTSLFRLTGQETLYPRQVWLGIKHE